MKSNYLVQLATIITMTFLFSCSNKDVEPREEENDDEEQVIPEPEKEALIKEDKTYNWHYGEVTFSKMQRDGKVIVVGKSNSTSAKVFRLDQDGKFDPTFNIDQDKTWLISKIDCMDLQSNGSVILGGSFYVNSTFCNIIRLTSTGLLDRTFNHHKAKYFSGSYMSFKSISTVFVQNDDKIVLAVSCRIENGYLSRLNQDGTEDTSYKGMLLLRLSTYYHPEIYSIAQLPDGRLVASGFLTFYGDGLDNRSYMAIINTNGRVDPSFNYRYSPDKVVLTIQNGKILVSGQFPLVSDPNLRDTNYLYAGIFRLNLDGSIDETFQKYTTNVIPSSILVLPDNSFVTCSNALYNPQFARESRVSVFDSNGKKKHYLRFFDSAVSANKIYRQPNGRYLVIGKVPVNNGNIIIFPVTIK